MSHCYSLWRATVNCIINEKYVLKGPLWRSCAMKTNILIALNVKISTDMPLFFVNRCMPILITFSKNQSIEVPNFLSLLSEWILTNYLRRFWTSAIWHCKAPRWLDSSCETIQSVSIRYRKSETRNSMSCSSS
jgi:hypothetical protein